MITTEHFEEICYNIKELVRCVVLWALLLGGAFAILTLIF